MVEQLAAAVAAAATAAVAAAVDARAADAAVGARVLLLLAGNASPGLPGPQMLVLSRCCVRVADDVGAAAQPRNSPAQAGWVGGKKNKGTHVGLPAAVRSRTRLSGLV